MPSRDGRRSGCESVIQGEARASPSGYRAGQPLAGLRSYPPMRYTLEVNGAQRGVDVEPETPLLWVLRDTLDLKGTKFGCGAAQCGACTVHMDGVPIRSCQTPVASVGSGAITTIEAIGQTKIGQHVQAAWIDLDVPQCGYCQAGQIMSATALLARVPVPTDHDINEAMSGNVCRCATYTRIRAAIKQAAQAGRA